MMTEMLHLYKLLLSTSMDYVTPNPHYLGTISAFGNIANLVQNSTCLVTTTRSISLFLV